MGLHPELVPYDLPLVILHTSVTSTCGGCLEVVFECVWRATYIQTPTPIPSMHQIPAKHGRSCMLNNPLQTKNPVKINYNSISMSTLSTLRFILLGTSSGASVWASHIIIEASGLLKVVQTQALHLHPVGTPRLSILRPGIVFLYNFFAHVSFHLELQTTIFCSVSWCVGFDNLKIVVNKQLCMSLVRNWGRRCNQKCHLRNRNCQPLCLEALRLRMRGVQMEWKCENHQLTIISDLAKRSL